MSHRRPSLPRWRRARRTWWRKIFTGSFTRAAALRFPWFDWATKIFDAAGLEADREADQRTRVSHRGATPEIFGALEFEDGIVRDRADASVRVSDAIRLYLEARAKSIRHSVIDSRGPSFFPVAGEPQADKKDDRLRYCRDLQRQPTAMRLASLIGMIRFARLLISSITTDRVMLRNATVALAAHLRA